MDLQSIDPSSVVWRGFSSLDEWVEAIVDRQEDVFPRYCFPCQSYFDEYVKNIHLYDNNQVISLLRELLVPYTTYVAFERLSHYENVSADNDSYTRIQEMLSHGTWMRLRNGEDEWEGLTWILELLPYHPLMAVNVLSTYFTAEFAYMHDHRVIGINECISIIEAKFINQVAGKEKILYSLKPREFECLIEKLYDSMGYDTILTPATRDGGKDVIATIKRTDGVEKVYVECKLYKTTKLSPQEVNALAGVTNRDNINRGVIFCTGAVSYQLKELDSRIQILSLTEILLLLNMHLGSNWDTTEL